MVSQNDHPKQESDEGVFAMNKPLKLDKDELKMVELIRNAACTMRPGDGIITVANVNRLVKVRTAAVSSDAL